MVMHVITNAASAESLKSPEAATTSSDNIEQTPSSTSTSMSSCLSASAFKPENESTTQQHRSRSDSEIEKDLADVDLNSGASSSSLQQAHLAVTSSGIGIGLDINIDDKDDPSNTKGAASAESLLPDVVLESAKSQIKPILSSRKPSRKARRIKFYRNGDRFHPGVTIPVSNGRYRTLESLFQDLTRLLKANLQITGALRKIYTMWGEKISALDELQDGQCYVCAYNNENFMEIEYNTTSQPLINRSRSTKSLSLLSKIYSTSTVSKCGLTRNSSASNTKTDGGSPVMSRLSERESVLQPRFITVIRNGTRPRKIMRLLLNKRTCPSFDHVLGTITQKVKLDTGYVRKVYNLDGAPVTQLCDFFGLDDVFFVYGTERASADDFRLERDENKSLQATRKNIHEGTKAKKPVKSKIACVRFTLEEERMLQGNDLDPLEFPLRIKKRYQLEDIISKGEFALVLKCLDRQSGLPFALKVMVKSKYLAKDDELSIDDEANVMKKFAHPNIVSLIMDVNQTAHMYLVLEYVSGGNLFHALTRAGTFSEDQSRIMMRHLASALVYLHYINLVHRDIRLDNLLVECDDEDNVVKLKLADFSLTCEANEPLHAICGTSTYLAPEILSGVGYGVKIDVWAAGVVLYMLLCGFAPFAAEENHEECLRDAIDSGVYKFPDPQWSSIGKDVRDLITKMLQSNPAVRLTSKDILAHSWTCEKQELPIDAATEQVTEDDN